MLPWWFFAASEAFLALFILTVWLPERWLTRRALGAVSLIVGIASAGLGALGYAALSPPSRGWSPFLVEMPGLQLLPREIDILSEEQMRSSRSYPRGYRESDQEHPCGTLLATDPPQIPKGCR